jgi:hypothetical protein
VLPGSSDSDVLPGCCLDSLRDWPTTSQKYCEGEDTWASHGDNDRSGGEKGALLYTLACTVKSRPGHADTLRPREEKKKEKELVVLPELGCLATFIGYVSHVSACPCQGRYPPHHSTFAPGDCPYAILVSFMGTWTGRQSASRSIRSAGPGRSPQGLLSTHSNKGPSVWYSQKNFTKRLSGIACWTFTYMPTLIAVIDVRIANSLARMDVLVVVRCV